MNNKNITHPPTGISAPGAVWHAFGASICTGIDGVPYVVGTYSGLGSDQTEILFLGIQATGSHGPEAVIWAMGERQRRKEARTAATAQARLADALSQVASALGAESAEAFVQRLPERIRPYAEAVLRRS